MSKNKTIVSLNQIIGIREFMKTYLKVDYKDDSKLTHYKMDQFLIEKGYRLPIRVSFSKINSKKINNGTYILVREESKKKKKGKIIAYENPLGLSVRNLMEDLQGKSDYNELCKTRKNILDQKGLIEDLLGNIIEKDEEIFEINVSINRQKKYTQTGKTRYKRKGKY